MVNFLKSNRIIYLGKELVTEQILPRLLPSFTVKPDIVWLNVAVGRIDVVQVAEDAAGSGIVEDVAAGSVGQHACAAVDAVGVVHTVEGAVHGVGNHAGVVGKLLHT